MEAPTFIDGIVAALILISAILARSRGFTLEFVSTLALIGVTIFCYVMTPITLPLLKESPILKDFISGNCELSIIALFAGFFLVSYFIVSPFSPLYASSSRGSVRSRDSKRGFVFGLLRGFVVVILTLFIYERSAPPGTFPALDDSYTAKIFARMQGEISEDILNDAWAWIVGKYEGLVSVCTSGTE